MVSRHYPMLTYLQMEYMYVHIYLSINEVFVLCGDYVNYTLFYAYIMSAIITHLCMWNSASLYI